jgi:hypothetical protein
VIVVGAGLGLHQHRAGRTPARKWR